MISVYRSCREYVEGFLNDSGEGGDEIDVLDI